MVQCETKVWTINFLIQTPSMDRGGGGVQLVGDHVKHIAVGKVANAELSAVGFQRDDIDINILSPAKVPVSYR